ncbi:Hypothetical protein SRAE_2000236000 [Strongyloides ratti]|uniref:Uncharacterized protein n=1 Tax=Strongyloides ratti TaxID=34506 RepID=A0A090MYS6_STRRB|nr:Hypothetical protein SRAE_2000236000 [Strongyloides ratti]CEF67699.1 Hypothetical protein SRAE_2000236000 [Strongyloides ratti]
MEENHQLKELLKRYNWKLKRYKEQNEILKKALKVEKEKIKLVFQMFEKILGKSENEIRDYDLNDIMHTISSISDINHFQNNTSNKENSTSDLTTENNLSFNVGKNKIEKAKSPLLSNTSDEYCTNSKKSNPVICQKEKASYNESSHQKFDNFNNDGRTTPEILEKLEKEIEAVSDSINTDSMIRKFSSLMSSENRSLESDNNGDSTLNDGNSIFLEESEKTPSFDEKNPKLAYYIEIPEKKSMPLGTKYRTIEEYLVNNKNDFLVKSQARQKKINQASQIRARIAIEKRAAAVEVLFGKKTTKDVQSILEMDTAKIKAFPESWMRQITRKSLHRAGYFENFKKLQKKEVEKCVNQFMGKVYCEKIKRVPCKR